MQAKGPWSSRWAMRSIAAQLVRYVGVCALVVGIQGPAWAITIEANAANVAQLDQLKGLGLKMAARIVDERQAHGPFKDWLDLVDRVRGIGEGSARRLSGAGLTVNGAPFSTPPLRKAPP